MAEGQAALFDAPPLRRLQHAPGEGWWGVDPGSSRIALATIHRAPGNPELIIRNGCVRSVAQREGGERLATLYNAAQELAGEWAELVPVGVVAVEQPSGKQPNPALSYATGAIIAGLWSGLALAFAGAIHVEMVASSKWKAVACGYGGIRKPKPTSKDRYGVLTWAQSVGYQGSSWDEADAWGVAEYARKTFALEVR